jgi:hypothetical protein
MVKACEINSRAFDQCFKPPEICGRILAVVYLNFGTHSKRARYPLALHALHLTVLIGVMLNKHICIEQKLLVWNDSTNSAPFVALLNLRCRAYKGLCIVTPFNPIHCPTPCFLYGHLIFVLSSTHASAIWSLTITYSEKKIV